MYPSTEFHIFTSAPDRHQVWRDVWTLDRHREKDCRSDLMGEYTSHEEAEREVARLDVERIASQEAHRAHVAALAASDAPPVKKYPRRLHARYIEAMSHAEHRMTHGKGR